MKFKSKIVIMLVAVLLSLLGFNSIVTSTSANEILKVGKEAGYEMISNYLAHSDVVVTANSEKS